jgi:hypothetical protein
MAAGAVDVRGLRRTRANSRGCAMGFAGARVTWPGAEGRGRLRSTPTALRSLPRDAPRTVERLVRGEPGAPPDRVLAPTGDDAGRWTRCSRSCYHAFMHPEVKRVGQSGQISVGRHFAGKLVRVEQLEDGRLLVTPVVDVPESQLWTLTEPHKSRIERGMAWAASHVPRETSLAEVVARGTRRRKR